MKLVVCITGASGAIYGLRTLEVLNDMGFEVDLIVSSSGWIVLKEEMDISPNILKSRFPGFTFHSEKDMASPIASGSRLIHYDGVLVCPCSTSTLAHIANGINSNLIHRVCEVALKERIPLLLLFREMPLSEIHLENMLKLKRAGAIIMPASPGFYHRPSTVGEIVDFVVGKVLDAIRVNHSLFRRWKEEGIIHSGGIE
ncbi:MAG: UbiX family flavin prenyltransferase [Aquificaceae bacterium]